MGTTHTEYGLTGLLLVQDSCRKIKTCKMNKIAEVNWDKHYKNMLHMVQSDGSSASPPAM